MDDATQRVVYIAGPMTGLPDHNFPAFNHAEAQLSDAGYRVLNPARHGSGEGTWADYMRHDLADVITADGIALLDGWQASKGATLEVQVANALGMFVGNLTFWQATAGALKAVSHG